MLKEQVSGKREGYQITNVWIMARARNSRGMFNFCFIDSNKALGYVGHARI